jgi:hypothetical protein
MFRARSLASIIVMVSFFLTVPSAGPTTRPQAELTTIVWPAVEPRFVAALVLTLGPKSPGTPAKTIEDAPEQAFASDINEPLPISIRDFDRDGDFGSAVSNQVNNTAAILAASDGAFVAPAIRPKFLSRWWRFRRSVYQRQRGRTWEWASLVNQRRWRTQ